MLNNNGKRSKFIKLFASFRQKDFSLGFYIMFYYLYDINEPYGDNRKEDLIVTNAILYFHWIAHYFYRIVTTQECRHMRMSGKRP